jgi:hypothetical protein
MARVYAGILGMLAFATELATGLAHAAATDATIRRGVMSLCMFAVVGYVVGRIAEWITDESVRGQLTSQLESKGPGKSET